MAFTLKLLRGNGCVPDAVRGPALCDLSLGWGGRAHRLARREFCTLSRPRNDGGV